MPLVREKNVNGLHRLLKSKTVIGTACKILLANMLLYFVSCKPIDTISATSRSSQNQTEFLPPKQNREVAATVLIAAGTSGCPKTNPTLVGGCLRIAENPSVAMTGTGENQRTVQLFYQWLSPVVDGKPTIVFVHGGPGGNMQSYLTSTVLKKLTTTHNVLLYDQRGTGGSSRFGRKGALRLYNHDMNVADLETVRSALVKQERFIPMGHSYGGHVVLHYATKYPEHVERLVTLNGAADGLGFILQQPLFYDTFANVIDTLFPIEKAKVFKEALTLGALRNEAGQSLSIDTVDELKMAISTFKGLTEDLPKLLKQFADLNQGILDKPLSALRDAHAIMLDSQEIADGETPTQGSGTPDPKTTSGLANLLIVCLNLKTPAALALLPESTDLEKRAKSFALSYREEQCKGFTEPPMAFDVKDKLSAISAPTLIVGGSHDILINKSMQERDFSLISKSNKNAFLLLMENTGHQVLRERPECMENALNSFLNTTLSQLSATRGSQRLNCADLVK